MTFHDNPVLEEVFKSYKGLVNEYVSASTQVKAATGDKGAAVKAFMDGSDDKLAVELRKAIEQATAKLQAHAEKNVKSADLSEDALAKLKAKMDTYKTKIREGKKAILGTASVMQVDEKSVTDVLDSIGDPTHSGRGAKSGTKGSGLPRYRAEKIVLTLPDNSTHEAKTFTEFAKLVDGYEVADLLKAFAIAANAEKTTDNALGFELKTVTKVTEFKVPRIVGGKEDGVYTVTVHPAAKK